MKHILASFSLIIPLSILVWALWYTDVMYIHYNHAYRWEREELLFPYAGILLCAVSFLFPFRFYRPRAPFKNFVLAGIVIFCISFLAYFSVKALIAYRQLERVLEHLLGRALPFAVITYALLLPLLFGLVHWFAVHRLVRKISAANIFMFLFPILAALIFSLLTYWVSMEKGEPPAIEKIFKHGYAAGWFTFFMGVAGIIISRQKDV